MHTTLAVFLPTSTATPCLWYISIRFNTMHFWCQLMDFWPHLHTLLCTIQGIKTQYYAQCILPDDFHTFTYSSSKYYPLTPTYTPYPYPSPLYLLINITNSHCLTTQPTPNQTLCTPAKYYPHKFYSTHKNTSTPIFYSHHKITTQFIACYIQWLLSNIRNTTHQTQRPTIGQT